MKPLKRRIYSVYNIGIMTPVSFVKSANVKKSICKERNFIFLDSIYDKKNINELSRNIARRESFLPGIQETVWVFTGCIAKSNVKAKAMSLPTFIFLRHKNKRHATSICNITLVK
jgi:hypothetical protein